MEEKKRSKDERAATLKSAIKRGGPVPQPADTKVVQKSGELRPVSSGIKKSPSNTAPTKTKKK